MGLSNLVTIISLKGLGNFFLIFILPHVQAFLLYIELVLKYQLRSGAKYLGKTDYFKVIAYGRVI